eukprot:COSAG06_NODE_264_length_18850_cov_2499.951848_5_plen_32_part_00
MAALFAAKVNGAGAFFSVVSKAGRESLCING